MFDPPRSGRRVLTPGVAPANNCARTVMRLENAGTLPSERQALLDYRKLKARQVSFIRESAHWSQTDVGGGRYDFSPLLPAVRAANATGMPVAWDLCRFDFPIGVSPFAKEFDERLSMFGIVLGQWLSGELMGEKWFVPFASVSILAWAAGQSGLIYPHRVGQGEELKMRLMCAADQVCAAMKQVLPKAKFFSAYDGQCSKVLSPSAIDWIGAGKIAA